MHHQGALRWDKTDPCPVDWRKQGLKRSTATEADGVPLGLVSAGANRHDSPLLGPTVAAVTSQVGPMPGQVTAHLDAAYDNGPTRALLDEFGFDGEISRRYPVHANSGHVQPVALGSC